MQTAHQTSAGGVVAVLWVFWALWAFVCTDAQASPRFEGLWAAPSVRVSSGPAGSQIFDVHGRHRVAVMPIPPGLHDAAHKELERCATGWRDIYSHAGDTAVSAYVCYWSSNAADAVLQELSNSSEVTGVMRLAFNVSGPCSTMRNWPFALHGFRRSWITALHASMPADVHHSDGCDSLSRRAGHDFFTVISWPNAGWQAEWGGELEFAAQECGDPADSNREISARTPPVLTVSPAPDRLVIFTGPLVHRSTKPSRNAPRAKPPGTLGAEYPILPTDERWRFSTVQQVTCPTARDPGPYEEDVKRRRWLAQCALSALMCVLCIHLIERRAVKGKAKAL